MSASYPGSVKIFASRSNGQTIDASHVGDLQDEVAAIEGGITQGTAPLNSSNSTVLNLSVTGNSTIAGNLTVAGTLTASGNFTFSTTVTANTQPRIRIFAGSTQALADDTDVAITFDSEEFDPQALHSTASNPTRINTTSTGVWLFVGTVKLAGFTGDGHVRFRKNGNTGVGSAVGLSTIAGPGMRAQVTAIEVISATTDYMELIARQKSGFSVQAGNASSRIDQNDFSAVKLW